MISIIISNYNHNKYIKRNLKSWYDQTYQDFEIILIDEHSDSKLSDDIPGIESLSKLILIENRTNIRRWLGDSWNLGLDLASGDYIVLFGADDIAYPTYLEENLKVLQKSNRKWITGGHTLINHKEEKLYDVYTEKNKITDDNIESILRAGGLACGSCMYEREILFKVGCFISIMEDRDMWFKLIYHKYYPVFLNKALYGWRQNSSTSRRGINKNEITPKYQRFFKDKNNSLLDIINYGKNVLNGKYQFLDDN